MRIRVNQRNINTDRVLLFHYNFGLVTYIMNRPWEQEQKTKCDNTSGKKISTL